jgi:ubiquinone/menaquinone biosynthesis C-methylase UbiE
MVYTREVLHHVSSVDAVCAEVYRVLKPKGLFIATREHVISKLSDLDAFLQNHPVHRYTGGENAHLLSEYRHALKRAGFRQVKVLGSRESVINYYPMSVSEFAGKCRQALCRRLGMKIGQYLAARRFILGLFGWYLTVRSRTPGRLYSFLAER